MISRCCAKSKFNVEALQVSTISVVAWGEELEEVIYLPWGAVKPSTTEATSCFSVLEVEECDYGCDYGCAFARLQVGMTTRLFPSHAKGARKESG